MSRLVIKTMEEIFNCLEKNIKEEHKSLIKRHERHIKASGDETLTISFVKDAKLLNFGDKMSCSICGLKYQNDIYIVTRSSNAALFETLFLEIVPDQAIELYQGAGMLAIAYNFLTLKEGISSLDLVDRCLGMDKENNCFLFEDICNLFEKYSVFKIDEHIFSFKYAEDFDRLEAMMLMTSDKYYGSTIQSNLNRLLCMCGSRSIAASIINGIKSSQWEYCYLQFYHCLEYLFAISNAIDLQLKYINVDIALAIDIASDGVLKKAEKDSLVGVISKYTPKNTLDNFCKFTHACDEAESKVDKAADYIYKIRCNLAHLRFKQDALPLKCEYDIMLDEITALIADTYENLEEKIIEICSLKDSWTELKA